MRDFDLRFSKWWPDADVTDLLAAEADDLPEEGGAYVIGTTRTPLVYPWGTSPVFYIGQSSILRRRLGSHRKWIASGLEFGRYWQMMEPKHSYGVALGADCCWFSASRHDKTPAELEATLILDFYWQYGSIPVANGAWPSMPAGEGEHKG